MLGDLKQWKPKAVTTREVSSANEYKKKHMSIPTWVAWCTITVGFNLINSINSRAKNSRSWRYNAISTALSAGLYILSMIGVGNIILKSPPNILPFAVAAHIVCSTIGSTAGQEIAIHYFKKVEFQDRYAPLFSPRKEPLDSLHIQKSQNEQL
jgi:hypothetical protein